MVRTFKRIKIGLRSFLAPSDSPAIISMLEEIAEFSRKNPEALREFAPNKPRRVQTVFGFKTTTKPVSKLSSLSVSLGPKGVKTLTELGNLKAVRARKILGLTGKLIRPTGQFAGIFAVSRVSRGVGLGLNILSVGPTDFLVSFAFAIAELQQNPDRFGSTEVTFAGDEEATRGEVVDVFGKQDVFVSQEALQISQLATEAVDQLAFGFIPEAGQRKATNILGALFVDPVLGFARTLAGALTDIQGDEPTVGTIGEAGF